MSKGHGYETLKPLTTVGEVFQVAIAFERTARDFYRDPELARNPDIHDVVDLNKYGQRLWAYCEHYLMSGNKEFIEGVMGEIKGTVNWIEQVIARDDKGLIPRFQSSPKKRGNYYVQVYLHHDHSTSSVRSGSGR